LRILDQPWFAGSAAAASVEVWAKTQAGGAVALLAINVATSGAADLDLDLAQSLKKLAGWCASGCKTRDVWARKDGADIAKGMLHISGLAPHDSMFVLVTPPS
jgi:hypothetical protein